MPLSGGLVGYTAYDAVRYFERLPGRSLDATVAPHAHYVAPRSLLVFDHLTRSVALLHDGSDAERESLRREVMQALRGAVPTLLAPGAFTPAAPSLTESTHADGVRRAQEYIAVRRCLPAGARVALRGAPRARPLRGLSGAAPAQSLALHVLLRARRHHGGGLLARSAGQIARRPCAAAADRGLASARRRCARAMPRLEAELLADPKENAEHVMLVDLARNDLGRVATAGSVRVEPYRVIERYSHIMHIVSGVSGDARAGPRCLRSVRRHLSRGHAGGRAEGAGHGDHRRARAGGTAALWRHGRLFRTPWRHGSGDHHPHAGVPRRCLQLPGRRRHRRRQLAPGRVRRSHGEERRAAARARASRRRDCELRAQDAADR